MMMLDRRIDGVEPLGFSATTDLKSAPQDRLGSIRHSYRMNDEMNEGNELLAQ
jgi:hypothetical protein